MSKQLFLEQNLQEGEIYAGLILGKNGERDYRLILLAAKPNVDLTWQAALDWAKSVGGDLPTCTEQSLLIAQVPEQFNRVWYWSNTAHVSFGDYAWLQLFSDGDQSYGPKSNEYSARAVRRIYIEENDMDAAVENTEVKAAKLVAPTIGSEWHGGIYAGVMGGENGQPDYYLIHAASEHELTGLNWRVAVDAARTPINGFTDWSLPDCREARLLFINSSDSFDEDTWYWTSTTRADDSVCAWVQDFSNGLQGFNLKSSEYSARAVRRIYIQE